MAKEQPPVAPENVLDVDISAIALDERFGSLKCKFKPRCPHFPTVSYTAPASRWESYLGYHAPARG